MREVYKFIKSKTGGGDLYMHLKWMIIFWCGRDLVRNLNFTADGYQMSEKTTNTEIPKGNVWPKFGSRLIC